MKKFLILVLLAGLTACKKEAPECSDKEVANLATEIIRNAIYEMEENRYVPFAYRNTSAYTKESLKEALYYAKEAIYKEHPILNPTNGVYILENIRTLQFNKDTGNRKCRGTFKMKLKTETVFQGGGDITYTVELTDDNGFYVSVLE